MPLYRVQHSLLRSGGYLLQLPRREDSAQTGHLFQVSGINREREAYKREGISQVEAYKRGREIGHLVI